MQEYFLTLYRDFVVLNAISCVLEVKYTMRKLCSYHTLLIGLQIWTHSAFTQVEKLIHTGSLYTTGCRSFAALLYCIEAVIFFQKDLCKETYEDLFLNRLDRRARHVNYV